MGRLRSVEWLGCWVLARSTSVEFMTGRRVFGTVGDHQETTVCERREVGWMLRRKATKMTYQRVTIDSEQMGGVPCIRGLRIPVATVVAMVADGMSRDEILAAYPDLEAGDIQEALHFAAEAVMERQLPLQQAS